MSCFPDLFVFIANCLNGDYKLTVYCTWDCWASSSTHHAVSSVSLGRLHLYMNCHIVQYSAVWLFTSSSLFTSVYTPTTKIICRSCSRSLCLSFFFFFILFWCAWQAMLGKGFHGNCMLNRHAWCLRVNHRQWRHSPLWSERQKKNWSALQAQRGACHFPVTVVTSGEMFWLFFLTLRGETLKNALREVRNHPCKGDLTVERWLSSV